MVGAADALDEAFDILGRADLDYEVDIAPVNAKIKGACANDGAQLTAHHCPFHTGALLAVKRAVVDADGQAFLVGEPEFVKENLGLRACVVEDESGVVGFDLLQNGGDRVGCTTT